MKQRIITAIIGIIIILPIILYGSWPFKLTIYLLATVALYELFRMFNATNYIYFMINTFFLWAFIYGQQTTAHAIVAENLFRLVIMYMVILLLFMVLSKNKFTFDDASRLMLAALFIGFSFYYMIEIRTKSADINRNQNSHWLRFTKPFSFIGSTRCTARLRRNQLNEKVL